MIPPKLRIIREKNRLYRYLLKLFALFTPQASRVYLFHDLKDDLSEVKSVFSITQTSFEKFLLKEIEKGNKPLSFQDLSNIILKKKRIKNGFYVTFDDANSSVFTKAYPFLKKHDIPFIIFITKELIGKENYLGKEEIIELAKDPLCTVGSHGIEHKMFRYYKSEAAKQRYQESQEFLQNLVDQEILSFAFPYGRIVECSSQNIKDLKTSNYKFAFSAIEGTLAQSWITGQYFLPRINVDESMVK